MSAARMPHIPKAIINAYNERENYEVIAGKVQEHLPIQVSRIVADYVGVQKEVAEQQQVQQLNPTVIKQQLDQGDVRIWNIAARHLGLGTDAGSEAVKAKYQERNRKFFEKFKDAPDIDKIGKVDDPVEQAGLIEEYVGAHQKYFSYQLHHAILYDEGEKSELLVSLGIPLTEDDWIKVEKKSTIGQFRAVQALFKGGVPADQCVQFALRRQNEPLLKWLMENGAEFKESYWKGLPRVIPFLLDTMKLPLPKDSGAILRNVIEMSVLNIDKRTHWDQVYDYEGVRIIEKLIKAGAVPTLDLIGLAEERGLPKIAKVLRDNLPDETVMDEVS